jgi:hypothetical protein
MCTVIQQKRTVPPTQSYRNIGHADDCQDGVTAVTLSMKEPEYQGKITSAGTSNESTSTDDSNVSVHKVMVKYQKARQTASFWKLKNVPIHVSLY